MIADAWLAWLAWLAAPIRPGAAAPLDAAGAWHATAMLVSLGVCAPLLALTARYWKVVPGQDWPQVLDHPFWWIVHRLFAVVSVVALLAGVVLALDRMGIRHHLETGHGLIGWLAVLMLLVLAFNGLLRGTTGGPGRIQRGSLVHLHERAGDHYDMTRRRRWFERTHKSLGYALLLAAAAAVISGLWQANLPRWVLIAVAGWWVVLLVLALVWERQGRAVDGYQARWGPAMAHPGNRIPALGWGSRRYTEESFRRARWSRWREPEASRSGLAAAAADPAATGDGSDARGADEAGPPTMVMWEAIVRDRTAQAARTGAAPLRLPDAAAPSQGDGPSAGAGAEDSGGRPG